MLVDFIAVILILYTSFMLKFEFSVPESSVNLFGTWILWFIIIQLGVFYSCGLYERIWRYTSLHDLYAIFIAVTLSCLISFLAVFLIMGSEIFPRSILFIYFILNMAITSILRLSVRVYYSHYYQSAYIDTNEKKKTLILIGAGKTGDKIAREILSTSRNEYNIACFVDDDIEKRGGRLHGIKVMCGIEDLPNLKINYDELLITAPSATGVQMRRIVDACKQTGKRYKTVPALNEILDSEIKLSNIRDVSYSDLLGREEVKLDMNSIEETLHGKRILITGSGGSIGSELVKQCLTFQPAEIICIDVNEEKIYQQNQFLETLHTKTVKKTVLANVSNRNELEKVFIEVRPHIVFHAAAYKHVPIQELHPWAAVKTNIGGTLNIIQLASKYDVEKFVLVSTDKAVNPVNIMGATKRFSEKLIQSINLEAKTCFMSVRFGNVLGSSGSAIPTFQKQINNGGPVTITHPEMTRYFMSIHEASQLILQCCALGNDGEVFLLKMGNPIKILQLAKDLIKLSGLEPDVDIPLVYTGLRPGEKLYEELHLNEEKKVKTNHKKIMILKDDKSIVPWLTLLESSKSLLLAAKNLDNETILSLLRQLLPSYSPRDFDTYQEKISIKSDYQSNHKAEA